MSGANQNDHQVCAQVLDETVIRESDGTPKRPVRTCMDKGYDNEEVDQILESRGIEGHVRRKGEGERGVTTVIDGKPRRWPVERTGAWLNNFRGLKIVWEVLDVTKTAMAILGCILIVFNRMAAQRRASKS